MKKGVIETVTGKWAIDCVSGKQYDIKQLRYIGFSKNHHYWIKLTRSVLDCGTENIICACHKIKRKETIK